MERSHSGYSWLMREAETIRTVGVEEEFLLVDPVSARPVAIADDVVAGSTSVDLEHELFRQQVETATRPCTEAAELLHALRAARAVVADRATAVGVWAVPVGAAPLEPEGEHPTHDLRYERIVHAYGELAHQSLVCAMHVHVAVDGQEEGVAITDRVRPWLPVLLALSTNSPYWRGRDTGHASWRSQIAARWPTAGPHDEYRDAAGYQETKRLLQQWGAAFDDGMLYYDVRLSARYPTVEIRVADVCADVEDALLVALLARALVAQAARSDAPKLAWRTDLLRAMAWRAARGGTAHPLVNPVTGELASPRDVLSALVSTVSGELNEPATQRRSPSSSTVIFGSAAAPHGSARHSSQRAVCATSWPR